jgi:hypothetical protein
MFLVQHGHGNGGNVDRALAAGDADGVIWSPCSYRPDSLRREIRSNAGALQMIDPQLYVAYAAGVIDPKKLPEYPWYRETRGSDGHIRPLTPQVVSDVVEAALEFQCADAGLTTIVSPAPALRSGAANDLNRFAAFANRSRAIWTRIGDNRSLFISLPIETPLLEPTALQARIALLGAMQRLGAAGFYVLVELDPAADADNYAGRFEQALWLVHRLSEFAPVRVGYCGLNGWLFRAAGAEATGAGWFQNRRFWSPSNWLDRSGGSRLERAALHEPLALLSPADLATVRDASPPLYGQLVAGAGPVAARLRASPPTAGDVIGLPEHAAQLFAVARVLDQMVGAGFQADARRIIGEARRALALRGQIAQVALTIEGVAIDGRPAEWERALRGLAARLGIQL